MNENARMVIPFSFDLSTLVGRSVASLYSHLVTRPTGRALRLGIESQIGEFPDSCLSVLDFTQVVVLDYSCADEAVAKLIQRYQGANRTVDVYFVARGLSEQHRDPIEEVLRRHQLCLVAEVDAGAYELLGAASPLERRVWKLIEIERRARIDDVVDRLGEDDTPETVAVLQGLEERRVVLKQGDWYFALSALIRT